MVAHPWSALLTSAPPSVSLRYFLDLGALTFLQPTQPQSIRMEHIQAIGRFSKLGQQLAAAAAKARMDVDEKENDPIPSLPNGFGIEQAQLLELLEVPVCSFT